MSSITQIQNQQINPLINQTNKKESVATGDKAQSLPDDKSEPVINRMSRQLNGSATQESKNISGEQTQNLIPDAGANMMGAQSGNITAEFVANLLNKSPYES